MATVILGDLMGCLMEYVPVSSNMTCWKSTIDSWCPISNKTCFTEKNFISRTYSICHVRSHRRILPNLPKESAIPGTMAFMSVVPGPPEWQKAGNKFLVAWSLHILLSPYIYTYVHIRTYIYIYMCMYVYVYIYTAYIMYTTEFSKGQTFLPDLHFGSFQACLCI